MLSIYTGKLLISQKTAMHGLTMLSTVWETEIYVGDIVICQVISDMSLQFSSYPD